MLLNYNHYGTNHLNFIWLAALKPDLVPFIPPKSQINNLSLM